MTTPIKLVSRGRISQLSHLINNGSGDWEMFKAGYEAAYKQPPLDLHDMDKAAIARRNPHDKLRYGFSSRALVFGPAPAVIHYDVFPRAITDLANQLFGTPRMFSMILLPSRIGFWRTPLRLHSSHFVSFLALR